MADNIREIAELSGKVCDLFAELDVEPAKGHCACISIVASGCVLGGRDPKEMHDLLDLYIKAYALARLEDLNEGRT